MGLSTSTLRRDFKLGIFSNKILENVSIFIPPLIMRYNSAFAGDTVFRYQCESKSVYRLRRGGPVG